MKNKEKSIGKKIFKIIGILLVIVIIFLVCAITVGALYLNNKLAKIKIENIDKNEIQITEGVEEELTEYRNIALLGIDSRADSYSKGNRSDCIIIASINNNTKKIKLVSVYRDTYLEITGRNLDKVTHAYSYGGPTLALSTLNTNLDLNITEFVTVNFEAVKNIVDLLGGIKINIINEEVSHIPGINEEGTYTLTGEQALAYSRIRHATGGDYVRTERMRTVITACLDKVKTKNISELNDLADKILPEIYTNINTKEVISQIPEVAKYSIDKSQGWPNKTSGKTINGIWYGIPITLENSVKQLHEYLFEKSDYQVSDKVKEISQEIIKKTGYSE